MFVHAYSRVEKCKKFCSRANIHMAHGTFRIQRNSLLENFVFKFLGICINLYQWYNIIVKKGTFLFARRANNPFLKVKLIPPGWRLILCKPSNEFLNLPRKFPSESPQIYRGDNICSCHPWDRMYFPILILNN